MSTQSAASQGRHDFGGASAADGGPAISFRALTHHFDDLKVVDDVTLKLTHGEFTSIVGPSGCGKTTMLNLAAGLLEVQDGSVEILDRPPRPGNSDVAYMLATSALLPWRTALDNTMFGSEIRSETRAEREERARRLLSDVGLEDFEQSHPKGLSQGMRQRVALARTFCMRSPILLMDEPFGALDALTKIQLGEVLLELWTQERRTVLFITHDLSEAVALSDRVVVMTQRPGRIQADIRIDLPRPRDPRALQGNSRFHEIVASVWQELEVAINAGRGEPAVRQ